MMPTQLVLDYINNNLTYDAFSGKIMKGGRPFGTVSKRGSNAYVILHLTLDTTYEGCSLHYQCYAHHVAWYLTYGEWASMIVDHIDRDGMNNRLDNLRLATSNQNQWNQRKGKGSKGSQYKGVVKRGSKYRAFINCKGKRYELGTYGTEIAAAEAYNAKARELHGAYASLNSIVA
jgi:HNH endonuclease/AP2 domain